MQVLMEHVQVHYIQHNFCMTMNMRFPIHTLIGLVPNNNMNERMNYVGVKQKTPRGDEGGETKHMNVGGE